MEEDYILIKKYIEGDDIQLKILIDKYTSSIYNFSSRFVGVDQAKDITQEVFIKVWKNLKKFDIEKSKFKTWIFIIARNTITDYFRKKKSIPFSFVNDSNFKEDEIEDEVILPDEVYEKLKDKEILNNFLNELNDIQKEIITLHYQEDMTFKEIGEVLSRPLNTVKSYHQRALILLRKLITLK